MTRLPILATAAVAPLLALMMWLEKEQDVQRPYGSIAENAMVRVADDSARVFSTSVSRRHLSVMADNDFALLQPAEQNDASGWITVQRAGSVPSGAIRELTTTMRPVTSAGLSRHTLKAAVYEFSYASTENQQPKRYSF